MEEIAIDEVPAVPIDLEKDELFEGRRDSIESLEGSLDGSLDGSVDTNRIERSFQDNVKKFVFFDFGLHATPFHDIMNNLTLLKGMYKKNSKKKTEHDSDDDEKIKSKMGTKTFSIKDFQSTQKKKNANVKISRFRPEVLTWDGSFFPDKKLADSLYRTPCRDPSGRVIINMGRDEAKGVTAWRPVQVDKNIPDPKFTQCSHEFQVQLLKHMDEVIEKVEREYKKSPSNTQSHSNLKARMGADLNNLKQRRDKLKRDLRELERNSNFSTGELG